MKIGNIFVNNYFNARRLLSLLRPIDTRSDFESAIARNLHLLKITK